MSLPFHLVKPMRGGKPLDGLYRQLEADPGWICQAKVNGKRALWDGTTLWSRQGNKIESPVAEALVGLKVMLDGEFLQDKLYLFDVPSHTGTLVERWKQVQEVVGSLASPFVVVCPLVRVWDEVPQNGWEGVVFKRLDSKYPVAFSEGKQTTAWIKYRAEWL